MGAAWTLLNELKLGDSGGCEGEVSGPEGAYFDFSDSSHWANEEARSVERLIADANAAEVYRKALKPFATIYAKQRREGREFLAFDLGMEAGSPQAQALAEACHLMGVLPAEHDDG